jgi:uncharacterized membrane protein
MPLRRPFGAQFLPGRGYDEGALVLATVLRFVAILVIIAAAVYLVRAFLQSRGRASQSTGPFRSPGLDELDLRYARGELSRSEYFERRADLMGGPAPPPATP